MAPETGRDEDFNPFKKRCYSDYGSLFFIEWLEYLWIHRIILQPIATIGGIVGAENYIFVFFATEGQWPREDALR